MLERLNVFLGGCGGKGAQDSDCIEALNQDRDALEKEGALEDNNNNNNSR